MKLMVHCRHICAIRDPEWKHGIMNCTQRSALLRPKFLLGHNHSVSFLGSPTFCLVSQDSKTEMNKMYRERERERERERVKGGGGGAGGGRIVRKGIVHAGVYPRLLACSFVMSDINTLFYVIKCVKPQ